MKRTILWLLLVAPVPAPSTAPSIEEVRRTCETLTNADVRQAEGYTLIERKPILVAKTQELCEQIEQDFESGNNKSELEGKISELRFIYASFIDRHRIDKGVNAFDIMKMGINHQLSPLYLRTERDNDPAKTDADVNSSIYWHPPQNPLTEEFSVQIKNLEIDPSLKWVRIEKLEQKGSTTKTHVTDIRNGKTWLMKWGDEMHADPVASRIFATLGYNVDLPHYFSSEDVLVILGRQKKKKRTVQQFVRFMFNAYKVNLSPNILEVKEIDSALVARNPQLSGYEGESYMKMSGGTLEPRSDIENRLGAFMSALPENVEKLELRGALLAHIWVGNWDTKEDNTLLSIVRDRQGYHLRGAYADIGVSLGVRIAKFPRDLKAGLVNEFPWDLVKVEGNKIFFNTRMNFHSAAFRAATYQDLKWMATKIAQVGPSDLESILQSSGWPLYLQKLYFHKLAERRRQLLDAFEVRDPHTYTIDRNYSYQENGQWFVKNGELVIEPSLRMYPQGLLHTMGRFRGFGW
ncbi:MAG: hypothetical protein K2X47_15250 [Bdellovibrionales bacterium]|nr:hypothetical protein [Bdellovibrionales bacterium]